MPHGTHVDKVYEALKKKGYDSGKAARIAQSQTGDSLKTGKPAKKMADPIESDPDWQWNDRKHKKGPPSEPGTQPKPKTGSEHLRETLDRFRQPNILEE
jgi:hypothetical protein